MTTQTVMEKVGDLKKKEKEDLFYREDPILVFEYNHNCFNDECWEGSIFNPLRFAPSPTKGKLGEWAVQNMYKQEGLSYKRLWRGGDLDVEGSHEEIKTSFVEYIPFVTKVSQAKAWFNQIRINYEYIKNYHLVTVFPNEIKILEVLNRDKIDFNKFNNGHGGTKDLKSITLTADVDNDDVFYRRNKELPLTLRTIYKIDASRVKINKNDKYGGRRR